MKDFTTDYTDYTERSTDFFSIRKGENVVRLI